MQTKNILKKRLVAIVFIVGTFAINSAKSQNDSLKNLIVVPEFSIIKGDTIFTKVEKPATFLAGMDGWRRYLEHNLVYPEKAQRKGAQGVVKISLLVDKEGKVSEVKALNDPGYGLAQEAERVLKVGPNWVPATQNGRKVNYRFMQTLTFQLQ